MKTLSHHVCKFRIEQSSLIRHPLTHWDCSQSSILLFCSCFLLPRYFLVRLWQCFLIFLHLSLLCVCNWFHSNIPLFNLLGNNGLTHLLLWLWYHNKPIISVLFVFICNFWYCCYSMLLLSPWYVSNPCSPLSQCFACMPSKQCQSLGS
jgi:hypothetical protein